jgi:hypothetical protein
MGFAQEMKDFFGGFQATAGAIDKFKTRKADQKYRNDVLDLNTKKLDATVSDRQKRYDITDRKLGLVDKGLEIKKELGKEGIAAKKLSLSLQKRALDLREKGMTDRQILDILKINERDLQKITESPAASTDNPVTLPQPDNTDYSVPQEIPIPMDSSGEGVDPALDPQSEIDAAGQDDGAYPIDDPSMAFARGGMVRKVYAASGGAIEEDPAQQEAMPSSVPPRARQAIPEAPTQQAPLADIDPAANNVDVTRVPTNEGYDIPKITATAKKAVTAGMKGLAADAKQKPEAISTAKRGVTRVDVHSSEGAPTPADIKQIDAKIDPDNALQPYMKGAARLATLYQFALDKGDTEAAQQVAKRILQYNMMAAKTQGTLAMQALQKGDLQSGTKLLADAYDNVPDGQHLDYNLTKDGNVQYKVMNGEQVVQQGVANTAQLWGMAKGVASGQEFLTRMAHIAGEGDEKSGRKMSYSQAVDAAGTASKRYEELLAKYNDSSDDEKKTMYADLKAADAQNQKAMKDAQYVAQKSGNKSGTLSKDITARRRALDTALPEDPNASEQGGRTWPQWFWGQDETGATKGPTSRAEAISMATSKGKALDPATLRAAQTALKSGKSRAAVLKRLTDNGYSTDGL